MTHLKLDFRPEATHNMTQNSRTGTYYHNTGNLSVKVTQKQCSLVFGTNVPIDDVVDGAAKGTISITGPKPPKGIEITSKVAPDGLRYFRFAIRPPVVRP